MLDNISVYQDWPSYADVFEHLPPRLTSRRPSWSDMTPVDISEQWREDWSSASVVNNVLVTDPAICQPGFDLPRRSWSLLNHFRTGQGSCLFNLHKCGLASSELCVRGQQQTMNNMVNIYKVRRQTAFPT